MASTALALTEYFADELRLGAALLVRPTKRAVPQCFRPIGADAILWHPEVVRLGLAEGLVRAPVRVADALGLRVHPLKGGVGRRPEADPVEAVPVLLEQAAGADEVLLNLKLLLDAARKQGRG